MKSRSENSESAVLSLTRTNNCFVLLTIVLWSDCRMEEEQRIENEQREREEAERLQAQEQERERTVQAAREKAEREAAEEEEQRLAEIARKETLAAEAAKKKEMLAKIPDPDQMKLDATPCEILMVSSPLCSGKLHKEGTQVSYAIDSSILKGSRPRCLTRQVCELMQGKKAFKERFFVLWRHPNLLSGDYTLFWYESETDQIPKGHQALPVGMYQVNMPKKRRKGYDFCFRIDMQSADDAEGRKFILAAPSGDPEGEEKVKMWQDALKKIEADSKAELAAAKLKANMATARAAGKVVSAFGGDTVRRLRCVVPG